MPIHVETDGVVLSAAANSSIAYNLAVSRVPLSSRRRVLALGFQAGELVSLSIGGWEPSGAAAPAISF
jgi:hypothetical protein